jgi:hypothetical protein
MRTLVLFVCFLGLSFNLSAEQLSEGIHKSCRLDGINFPAHYTAADRLGADLSQGVWVNEEAGEEKAVYQFHSYGVVDIITSDANGKLRIESKMWKIEQVNGGLALVMHDSYFNQEIVFVESTCEGIHASSTDSVDGIELVLKPSISSKELDRLEASLIGEWNSVTFPSDLAVAMGCATEVNAATVSMHLEFDDNGAYTKICATGSSRMEERGFYEITPDGQYIIFYASGQPGNPAETYQASVVRIQYLNIGEMVLEQPVSAFGFAGLNSLPVREIAYMQ